MPHACLIYEQGSFLFSLLLAKVRDCERTTQWLMAAVRIFEGVTQNILFGLSPSYRIVHPQVCLMVSCIGVLMFLQEVQQSSDVGYGGRQ